ncbi:MAG: AAA family ATPase, partial [Pseudomonadota bacterium]
MTNLIETLIEESLQTLTQARKGVYRHYEFPQTENMIKVAIGMRRSGKTYFLYQTINKLLEQGIKREQILYINFEDERILPMDAKQMGVLLDSFYTLYPKNHQRKCYIFLDEVQNVTNWYLTVRRYFDSKNVELFLTGSSAKLLSKEINTSLRGRSLAIEILPYSFNEYLAAHGIKLSMDPFGRASFDIALNHLRQYINLGGFPAVQFLATKDWRETLQSYL